MSDEVEVTMDDLHRYALNRWGTNWRDVLAEAQAEIERYIHQQQRQRITEAKKRARIVTRAKGSKRHGR